MINLLKKNTGLKKVGALFLTTAMLLASAISTPLKASAESTKEEVLYLEVSNTLTAHDTFAWDTYDHKGYIEPRYTQLNLSNHIIFSGDDIRMMGYGQVAYKDFLLVNDNENTRKILSFDIQRDTTDWHSMEGGGFLFNTSIENDKIQGFCALITSNGLKLYKISPISLSSFRNGYNTGRTLLGSYNIGNVYSEHHIKMEVSKKYISLWDGDKLIIDKYELPENDYGYGYGPITSHISHSCWQQSYFTFSNIKMETVTGYYIKLEQADDEWGLTDDYWADTFTLETIEYTPEEDETIRDFSEHPMFKDTVDMILFYPDGSFEHIPWSNGKADYDNAERYIDLFNSNAQDASIIELEPGEIIIGAYAKA